MVDSDYLESWVLNIINPHKLVARSPLNRVKNQLANYHGNPQHRTTFIFRGYDLYM